MSDDNPKSESDREKPSAEPGIRHGVTALLVIGGALFLLMMLFAVPPDVLLIIFIAAILIWKTRGGNFSQISEHDRRVVISDPKLDDIRYEVRAFLAGTLDRDASARMDALVENNRTCRAVHEIICRESGIRPDQARGKWYGARANIGDEYREDESSESTITPEKKFRWKRWAMVVCAIVAGVYVWNVFVSLSIESQSATSLSYTYAVPFMYYASKHPDGLFPPLAPYEDLWIFDTRVLYPKYIKSLTSLVAPGAPNKRALVNELKQMEESGDIDWERVARIAAQSYIYLGWTVTSFDQVPELAEQRRSVGVGNYNSALVNDNGKVLFRWLEEDVERFFVTDRNDPRDRAITRQGIPIVIETLYVANNRRNKRGGAGFMGGHPESLSPADLEMVFDALYPDGVPDVDGGE
jgi:hypothetical protein